jgi:hypothetical protein
LYFRDAENDIFLEYFPYRYGIIHVWVPVPLALWCCIARLLANSLFSGLSVAFRGYFGQISKCLSSCDDIFEVGGVRVQIFWPKEAFTAFVSVIVLRILWSELAMVISDFEVEFCLLLYTFHSAP